MYVKQRCAFEYIVSLLGLNLVLFVQDAYFNRCRVLRSLFLIAASLTCKPIRIIKQFNTDFMTVIMFSFLAYSDSSEVNIVPFNVPRIHRI